MKSVGTIVIGAGQCGLAVSSELSRAGHEHVVLERGMPGNSWRKHRWDSMRLLTPNWMNNLCGADYTGSEMSGFMHATEFADMFDRAISENAFPIRTQTSVLAVRSENGRFRVETSEGDMLAEDVVMANGACAIPRIPALADQVPAGVVQLTPHSYKRTSDLAPGPVLKQRESLRRR